MNFRKLIKFKKGGHDFFKKVENLTEIAMKFLKTVGVCHGIFLTVAIIFFEFKKVCHEILSKLLLDKIQKILGF